MIVITGIMTQVLIEKDLDVLKMSMLIILLLLRKHLILELLIGHQSVKSNLLMIH